jgi:hypothetical protein
MAKRNSMSRARRSRNSNRKSTAPAPTRRGDESEPSPLPHSNPRPADIIGNERARLMKAQAVLGCLAFALLYEDWLEGAERPSFVDAVAAIQGLINETVERLGSS